MAGRSLQGARRHTADRRGGQSSGVTASTGRVTLGCTSRAITPRESSAGDTGAQRRLLAQQTFISRLGYIGARSPSRRRQGGNMDGRVRAELATPETFADASSTLRDYGTSLDRLASVVAEQTTGLRDHAPQVAQAAHAFTTRVVAQLGSQLPHGGPRQLLDAPFELFATELEGLHFAPDLDHATALLGGRIACHAGAGTLARTLATSASSGASSRRATVPARTLGSSGRACRSSSARPGPR